MPLLNTKKTALIIMSSRVAVLSSGGLDSAVMLVELCRRFEQIYPVYIRCGLFWEGAEPWMSLPIRAIKLLKSYVTGSREFF